MGAPSDMAGDLIEMHLHGLSVGIWHGNRCASSTCRTYGAKEIGILIALIGRLAGPRSAPAPLADDAILLTDAGLVLEPYLHRRFLWQVSEMGTQRLGEVFLNAAMVSTSCPGWHGRALTCENPSFFKSVPTYRS